MDERAQIRENIINNNLPDDFFYMNSDTVPEGLYLLNEALEEIKNACSFQEGHLSALGGIQGFYGLIGVGNLAEDNVLYDLEIPEYNDKGINTENYTTDIIKTTEDVKQNITELFNEIQSVYDIITEYSLKEDLVERLKNIYPDSNYDFSSLTDEQLKEMTIDEILDAYNVDKSKLEAFKNGFGNTPIDSVTGKQVARKIFGEEYENMSEGEQEQFVMDLIFMITAAEKTRTELYSQEKIEERIQKNIDTVQNLKILDGNFADTKVETSLNAPKEETPITPEETEEDDDNPIKEKDNDENNSNKVIENSNNSTNTNEESDSKKTETSNDNSEQTTVQYRKDTSTGDSEQHVITISSEPETGTTTGTTTKNTTPEEPTQTNNEATNNELNDTINNQKTEIEELKKQITDNEAKAAAEKEQLNKQIEELKTSVNNSNNNSNDTTPSNSDNDKEIEYVYVNGGDNGTPNVTPTNPSNPTVPENPTTPEVKIPDSGETAPKPDTYTLVSSINSIGNPVGTKKIIPGTPITTTVTKDANMAIPTATALSAAAAAGIGATAFMNSRKADNDEENNKFFDYEDYSEGTKNDNYDEDNYDMEFDDGSEIVNKEKIIDSLENN